MKTVVYVICLLSICLGANAAAPCRRYDIFGSATFVQDSQFIYSQGKFAVEELQGKTFTDLSPDDFIPFEDLITEDDVLNISLYCPARPDFVESIQFINGQMGGFRVSNGMVLLPGLPPVAVVGMTLSQGRLEMRSRFREQIRDIDVFIAFKERKLNNVELTGLVQASNIPVDGRVRLYEILAKAALPPESNLYASYVERCGVPLKIDMYRLIKDGDMTQNIVMRGGDKIYIGGLKDHVAMVMGEVGMPRPIPLPAGYISLKEALTLAGGIPFTGDKRHIQVIRGGIESPKIYSFSWKFIIHEPNKNILLIPGDVVYVSQTPITQWGLFIKQLEPTMVWCPTALFINQVCQ